MKWLMEGSYMHAGRRLPQPLTAFVRYEKDPSDKVHPTIKPFVKYSFVVPEKDWHKHWNFVEGKMFYYDIPFFTK